MQVRLAQPKQEACAGTSESQNVFFAFSLLPQTAFTYRFTKQNLRQHEVIRPSNLHRSVSRYQSHHGHSKLNSSSVRASGIEAVGAIALTLFPYMQVRLAHPKQEACAGTSDSVQRVRMTCSLAGCSRSQKRPTLNLHLGPQRLCTTLAVCFLHMPPHPLC